MDDWKSIETAPRSSYVEKKVGKNTLKFLSKSWVQVSRNGEDITLSYWLPQQERWVGFTKDSGPTHWRIPPPVKKKKNAKR